MSEGIPFMRLFCALTFVTCVAFAAEKKVKLEDLPQPVQAAVKEQTRKATLVGISTEKEKGKTMYEVETKVNGKGRDMLLDQTGAIVETEEEVDINAVPSAARAALQKRAGDGSLSKVEKVTAGKVTSYEGTIKTKAGKTIEYAVTADGKHQKED
jgi:uncharacterized membrane protein YkoI